MTCKGRAFMGSKLMEVFSKGNEAKTFAYSITDSANLQDITEWFWRAYLVHGKSIYQSPSWNYIRGSEIQDVRDIDVLAFPAVNRIVVEMKEQSVLN